MKTTTENDLVNPKHPSARKRMPSKLNPFTDELLRMGEESKPLHEIVEWLKVRGVETSINNVSAFLISRREQQEAKQQFDREKNPIEAFQAWMAENPNASLEAVMERFKMLALNLSLKKEAAPEVLKLADRLSQTAIRFVNAQSREAYRKRKLVMEEAKHAEWVKCERTRAFELCLDETKKYPDIEDMYRAAFEALKERQRQEGGV
jgi:hypothetical protein